MSKHKLNVESNDQEGEAKRASFLNISNFKAPKRRAKFQKNVNKSTEKLEKAVSTQSPASSQSTDFGSQPECKSQATMTQQATQEVLSKNGEIFHAMQSIKRVLEYNFTDVSGRLQLQAVPPQLYGLKAYKNEYKIDRKLQFASTESVYVAKNFFTEDRHIQFISLVGKSMVGQKKYPGTAVIRYILEMILKIANEDSLKPCMSVQQTLVDLYSLFTSVLATFPTIPFRADYLKLFETQFNVAWLKTGSTSQGIFHAMFDLLTDLIHQNESKRVKKLPKEQDKMNNFFYWDVQNEENFSFENFPREDKFERVFLVLDLLIQILENNLALFIAQYSNKLRTCINNKLLCPLVSLVLWKSHESVNVLNDLTKNIISIFVMMIGLQYPKDKISVVSRLLNLISHVLNLHEYPDERFDRYPIYSNKTTDLVREIQKTVENSVYYSMDLITSVAEHIRSPLIQMLYVDQMLKKITSDDKPISLEVPYKLILNKDFAKFKDTPKPVATKLEKYPAHDPKIQLRRAEISQREFLKLLEVYAGAVNIYYCIQVGHKAVDKQKSEEVKVPVKTETFTFADFEERVKTADLDEPVQLRQVNIKKLVQMKLSKEICGFYRNEIKHFLLLIRLIKKCHEKFGSPFDELMRLIETMEA